MTALESWLHLKIWNRGSTLYLFRFVKTTWQQDFNFFLVSPSPIHTVICCRAVGAWQQQTEKLAFKWQNKSVRFRYTRGSSRSGDLLESSSKVFKTGFFLCVFEKLKEKKTQAPKKLKVFSAPKLKLPEVFRPFLRNSIAQSMHKKLKKILLFCFKTAKTTV